MAKHLDYFTKVKLINSNYTKNVILKTNTGQRYILCNNAPDNWGKTTLLAEVADYYLNNPTIFQIICKTIYKFDRWAVVREIATGKIILIQTKGDVVGCFSKTFKYLLDKKNPFVDIIICACHPNNSTHRLVEKLARNTFNLYYFRNFSIHTKPWILPASTIVKDELKESIISIVNQL